MSVIKFKEVRLFLLEMIESSGVEFGSVWGSTVLLRGSLKLAVGGCLKGECEKIGSVDTF